MFFTLARHVFLSALCLVLPAFSSGEPRGDNREYEIKTAFLYNFIKFIDWPQHEQAARNQVFVICVLGENPSESLIEKIEGRSAKGRIIKSLYLKNVDDIHSCDMVFASQSAEIKDEEWLRKAESHAILTVGERERFVQQGGMIGFVIVDNHVGLQINRKAIQAAKLFVSSRLLRISEVVE